MWQDHTVLGRLQLAKGHVTVLGESLGARGHHIPGRDVGYMPQVLWAHSLSFVEKCLYN